MCKTESLLFVRTPSLFYPTYIGTQTLRIRAAKSATFLWFKHHCLKMRQYLHLIEIIKQQIKAIICWDARRVFGVDAHLFFISFGYACTCLTLKIGVYGYLFYIKRHDWWRGESEPDPHEFPFVQNVLSQAWNGIECRGTEQQSTQSTNSWKKYNKLPSKKGKCSIVYDLGSNYAVIHSFVCSCFQLLKDTDRKVFAHTLKNENEWKNCWTLSLRGSQVRHTI